MKKNKAIIKSIKALLSEYAKSGGSDKDRNSLRYLLGQSIRQYDIPEKKYHISVCAKQRWQELSKDIIANYWYRKQVKCDNLKVPKSYDLYKGSTKKGVPTTLNPMASFTFRDMFHEEHIIPVKIILEKLIGTTTINDKTIKGILDDMHICIILKEEDRMINQKFGKTANRRDNFAQNVKCIYNACGINLLPR